MTEPRPSFRLTPALSNKLRHRYKRYFRAYYKALRREIDRAIGTGADPDSIPYYYKAFCVLPTNTSSASFSPDSGGPKR